MPFPTPSTDLMASAMGGPLVAPTSSSTNATATNKSKKDSEPTTVRLFYSLKDNPNSIISYSDLKLQDQKRQQRSAPLSSKAGSNPASSSATPSVAQSPLKNPKATTTKDANQTSTSMDVDPPEGEEALGDGDSEAEDDDEAVDDDEEEAEAEAEDEDEDDEDEEEDDDDPEPARREPRDFLESLTEKYAGIEDGNESEDDDEDDDGDNKSPVKKRPSRWDTEHYDMDDEFIDDSEMMLESIGMVRPKVDGFFAFRGPVETTIEDADSSDAGPRSKKSSRRRPASGASPLNTSKGSSKSNKGSSLAVMENANDSTSEMSEVEEKSRSSKPSTATAGSGLANTTTASTETAASSAAESTPASTAAAPTKKKSGSSKSKSAGKDISKDSSELNKDSDKESKATAAKKAKPKSSKAATSSTPTVRVDSPSPKLARVDSPPPLGDINEDLPAAAVSPPPPPRSASPSKSKSKSKSNPSSAATTTTEIPKNKETASAESESDQENDQKKKKKKMQEIQPESSKSKEPKALEPLNDEVQKAYDVVAALAKDETWEVKSRFPPHIKEPLWECAKIALATRSTGYVLDDVFFLHLQNVLPYNKFTLKKLVYKSVLPTWIEELEVQRGRLISQFSVRTDMVWKASGLAGKGPIEKDDDGDVKMNGDDAKQKKFPWTQDLRMLLWETMEKFMEIHAAKTELRAVDESQPAAPSDSKTRKDAYQTLLQSFPTGWMTSYEISRQYSQLKEKVQKMEKKESDIKFKPNEKGLGVYKYGGLNAAKRIAPTAETMVENRHPLTLPPKLANSSSNLTAATASFKSSTSNVVVQTTQSSSQSHSASNERDNTRKASPNKSPSTTSAQRSAPIPETVASTTHVGQPRSQHHYYNEGSPSDLNKKRKTLEEGHSSLGSGSSHDPLYIDEPTYDDARERNYRQSSGNNGGNSSSPSIGSSSQPLYKTTHTNDAAKKKRTVDQRPQGKPSGSPMSIGVQPHHQSQSSAQSQYYQDYKNDYPDYPDYPDHPDYQRSRDPYPQSFPSRQSHGYAPPSSQRHYSHVESSQPHQSYLHRGPTQGAPPSSAGSPYGGQHPPPSRSMPPAQPHPGSNAMSMSNLLHHPHPSHTHHPRQGPM